MEGQTREPGHRLQDAHRHASERPHDPFRRKATAPLAGLVVADFSRVLAGPYCTMLLADLGATVVKVEGPADDETRSWMPTVYEDQSTYYLSIDRNKRSICLDFDDPADLAASHRIADSADVVVENFKPKNLDRFGLGYSQVAERNTDVVYASITGFGPGAGSDIPGYDLLMQAASALMRLTGHPESSRFRSGVAVFDVITGLHAAVGVLSALQERNSRGQGQLVEVNLMTSALSGMVNQTGGFLLTGKVPVRQGNEHPSIYPYEPVSICDGEIVIAIGKDRQFARLCAVLGAPHLSEDARFATAPGRSTNRAELRPILHSLFRSHGTQNWFRSLASEGIPCAPINDVGAGFEFASKLGLEPVIEIDGAQSSIPSVRNPITLSRTPPSYDLAPPPMDAGRTEILHWLDTLHHASA